MNISEFIGTDKQLKMRVYDELITLTLDTILKTNKHLADNAQGCINEALSGEVYVNPAMFDEYIKSCEERKESYLKGDFELTLGYYQDAYLIQTGKSIPLLS